MNRAKKYFLNALLLSGVSILIRAVLVSYNAYVTQKIGSEAVGLFTLVMSVYTFAITLGCSGVNLASVRMTAECYAKCDSMGVDTKALKAALRRELWGCIRYSLFFGFFAAILLFLLSNIIGVFILKDERTVLSLKMLAFAIPAISLSSSLSGYFTGLRKVYKNAIISISEQLVKITITTAALAVIAPRGIEYACLSVVGGSAVSEGASLIVAFVLFLFDKNKTAGKVKKAPESKGSPLSKAAEIAFPTALGSYVRQGLLCCEHIAIPASLRRFGNGAGNTLSSYGALHAMAFPLIFFPSSVIGAFASLLIPELSECSTLGQHDRVKRIGEKVLSLTLIFAIACGGAFLAFGNDMGESIYKNSQAGRYICAFAPLVPVMYLDTAIDSVLKGLGKQLYCMKVNILDSLLSLVLVLLLVPRLGTVGYVICVYIAETVNFILSLLKMLSDTGIGFSHKWLLRPIISILIATTAVRCLTSFFPALDEAYLEIILTSVFYSALIIPKSVFLREKSYKREKASITP